MSTPRQITRLAIDPKFLDRIFRHHWPIWFPRKPYQGIKEISVLRNYLQEFKSVTVQYWVSMGKSGRVLLHAQSRAWNHEQADAPKAAYQTATHLYHHGFSRLIYRPLAYIPTANLLVYQDVAGIDLMTYLRLDQGRSRAAVQRLWLASVPRVAQFLRKLHGTSRPPGIPAEPRADLAWVMRKHIQTIALADRRTANQVAASIHQARQLQPSMYRQLNSPSRRRLTHGDFHLGHVLRDGSALHYIDFGDAAWQEPAQDIARWIVQTHNQLPHLGTIPQLEAAVQQRYYRGGQARGVDAFALQFFSLLNLAQMLSMEITAAPRAKRSRLGSRYLRLMGYHVDRISHLI